MNARYAVYYAPDPRSTLWALGSATIGYDAETGRDLLPEVPPAFAAEWEGWTAEPRRYGFHATLKAPFALRPGHGAAEVLTVAEALASALAPVPLPRLAVSGLGRFVALVLDAEAARVGALAARCLEAFEPLRAPLERADRARRLAAELTPRQRSHLDRYGYPYVLDDFLFHMTLTGSLPPERREPVHGFLAERFRGATMGAVIDGLAIFRQDTRSDRFRLLARVPLRGEVG